MRTLFEVLREHNDRIVNIWVNDSLLLYGASTVVFMLLSKQFMIESRVTRVLVVQDGDVDIDIVIGDEFK